MDEPPLSAVFVTQDYAPDRGGMARRHVELCRRLAPDRVVVSTVAAPTARAFDAAEPYEIARQPFPFSRANRFVNQMRWARWLTHTIDAGAVDLVHCGNIRPCGYTVWWASRRTGVPYILYVNGGDLLRERVKVARNPVKRHASRGTIGRAAGIVANSAWTADTARELLAELAVHPAPPVAAIDLGTDPAWFSPARDTGALRRRLGLGGSPLLLTVARLVRHKGQDVGIRVLARLAGDFPSLRYVLVGEGEEEHHLRRLAAELGVGDRVVFAGPLPDDDVAEAYATSTIYLGPSRLEGGINVEGFGIAFVEAASSGIPSVAGDSGGVRAAVRDGETGLLVPPTDDAAVAAAVADLLRDPERRRRMGAAGRRAVETYYNWDRVAHETREFARGLVRRTGGGRARGGW